MVSFQTKNPNLGKFWKALDWKILINFMAIWDILQTFYDHLVHLCSVHLVHFSGLGNIYQEKSGNHGIDSYQFFMWYRQVHYSVEGPVKTLGSIFRNPSLRKNC
jgi:hypothetical protein